MARMCEVYGIAHDVISYSETEGPTPADIRKALTADPSKKYSHVGVIHHETTAGTLNPINAIGNDIRALDPEITFIVDSMSGFGAYDVDVHADNVHYLVSSANKNIEGIPGFSFAICDWERLQKQGVHARTLSLDLLDQIKALNATGQFRFTPPVHSMLAFAQALVEHKAEGGQPARLARYTANFETLRDGMREMGFETYLPADKQGVIISTFLFPDDPNFNFQHLYKSLSDRGMVIYPGKLTKADCFRIGTIGQLYPYDIQNLLSVFKEILVEMGVKLPVKQIDPEQATSKMASFA
jgi:2-aminoethylphosphonate-pyruvate transaminase